MLQKRIARIIFGRVKKRLRLCGGGATTPTESYKSLKMNELRGAAPRQPVSVKKKMQFCETFFLQKVKIFLAISRGCDNFLA
jgi:hypothetical protein